MVGKHRYLNTEQGSGDGSSEQVLVALVIGVRHQGDTRGEKFGASRFDLHRAAVWFLEAHPVVGGRLLFVLEFGLSDRGAEGDVPEGGCLSLVGLPALDVAQESALGGALGVITNGAVGLSPVDGEAEHAPDIFELFLILDGQALAEFDEVAARNWLLVGSLRAGVIATLQRGNVAHDVRQARVAAHAVVVLHATLGGQTVVIPAHRVEDALAQHALVARNHVHVGVAKDVANVERTGGRGRGSVDREHSTGWSTARIGVRGFRGDCLRPVKPVDAVGFPRLAPLGFESFEGGLFRNDRHGRAPVHFVRHRV